MIMCLLQLGDNIKIDCFQAQCHNIALVFHKYAKEF